MMISKGFLQESVLVVFTLNKRSENVLTARESLVDAVSVDCLLRLRLPVGGLRGHVESGHGRRRQRRQRAVQWLTPTSAYC